MHYLYLATLTDGTQQPFITARPGAERPHVVLLESYATLEAACTGLEFVKQLLGVQAARPAPELVSEPNLRQAQLQLGR